MAPCRRGPCWFHSPGTVWEPRAKQPHEAGRKAVVSLRQMCSWWVFVALLADAQLCPSSAPSPALLSTTSWVRPQHPAVPLSTCCSFAFPRFIAPLKYLHCVHLLFNAADEKTLCQAFLVMLCQLHHRTDAGSEPSRTQASFWGICLPRGDEHQLFHACPQMCHCTALFGSSRAE